MLTRSSRARVSQLGIGMRELSSKQAGALACGPSQDQLLKPCSRSQGRHPSCIWPRVRTYCPTHVTFRHGLP
eukprot:3245456-Amphidinium_carterae.1